jgi:hypothetical protein
MLRCTSGRLGVEPACFHAPPAPAGDPDGVEPMPVFTVHSHHRQREYLSQEIKLGWPIFLWRRDNVAKPLERQASAALRFTQKKTDASRAEAKAAEASQHYRQSLRDLCSLAPIGGEGWGEGAGVINRRRSSGAG